MTETSKTVESKCENLQTLFFANKFKVDFYQRAYVWTYKNIEDLIKDLTSEFLKNYKDGHPTDEIKKYDPYFMGGVVLSKNSDSSYDLVDGQQRITSLTLFLIYLKNKYKDIEGFPSKVSDLIYSDDCGKKKFNIDIVEREECLKSLNEKGHYQPKETDDDSVKNIVERYEDIDEIWSETIDKLDKISAKKGNIIHFTYWLMQKVYFSKIETNSDDFAYVIFESMNDRGCSLTQTEMLRSFLLANIKDVSKRTKIQEIFDKQLSELLTIKASKKTKIDIEFFRNFLRSQYAQTFTPEDPQSDFNRIGREFHRWVSDNLDKVCLEDEDSYCQFIELIVKYMNCYIKINEKIVNNNSKEYLYLVANNGLEFTLQYPLIIASIDVNDTDDIIDKKIKIVSKFVTKFLLYRIWNQRTISQSTLDTPIFNLCYQIRRKNVEELIEILTNFKDIKDIQELKDAPIMFSQNKKRLKVLIAVVTEIIAKNAGQPNYLLNEKNMEVEHIWADHYDRHTDEFEKEEDFKLKRNTIGDLLILPKSFNASYGDLTYEEKVEYYIRENNILAQSLHKKCYEHYPKLSEFLQKSQLKIVSYEHFYKKNIDERSELYKQIILWNFKNLED